MTTDNLNSAQWITVCSESDLTADTGLCALHGGEQVAIFKPALANELYALSNFDPFGKANVMSRGIIGSIGETLVVASPLYKQHFDLKTGECLEDDSAALKTYQVRVEAGQVQLLA
ncbi:MAG: nitrite reductase (NADH) small subunit [Oleispira sp.]|jgi:nitrite reductase (NADH) small subunit